MKYEVMPSGPRTMMAPSEENSPDPERLALALLAALQGGLVLTQARRDTVALETALDTMIDGIRCYQPARGDGRPAVHR